MDRILGQDDALAIIRRSLRSGRMHHAWIFSGPVGVGKCTTALELAKIMLDPDATEQVDPESRAARLVETRSHPDLHLIYKELALYSDNPSLRQRKLLNIPLDLLRERMLGGRTSDDRMHDAAAYRTPIEAPSKVFVIDEAELIDVTGQNALLKTLEEPPAATFIFLITSRPERLLPTIRSRSQSVRFGPLNPPELRQWLDCAALDVPADELAWIEGFCDGSPGVAKLAADFGFSQWQQTLEPMIDGLQRGRFPAPMGETLAALVDEFAQSWVKQQQNASKDAANKMGARHLLRLLAAHARQRLSDACATGGDPMPWLRVVDLLLAAEQDLDANVNLKHLFENLVAQWAQPDALAPPLGQRV
ncbi:MAG: DNA polymerase III subunit [Planctomycetota bacterium]